MSAETEVGKDEEEAEDTVAAAALRVALVPLFLDEDIEEGE